MKKEVKKAIEYEVARIVSRAMKLLEKEYGNKEKSGILRLQDFFLALPFQIVINIDNEVLTEEEKESYPSVFHYLRGHTKMVKDNYNNSYLKVYIDIFVPNNIKTVEEGIEWVQKNIINNKDLKGEYAFLLVYLHEVLHILLKHLLPLVNAKFNAVIDKHLNGKKIPPELRHEIINIAEDFYINSILLENANNNSKFKELAKKVGYVEEIIYNYGGKIERVISGVENPIKTLSFYYHPKLSANKEHTVETIIEELMKRLETEDMKIKFVDINNKVKDVKVGTKYIVKYEDYKYVFYEVYMGSGSNCNKKSGIISGSGEGNEEIEKIINQISNQIANKIKGSGSIEIAKKLGLPVEVTVDWLERLESNLFKEVRYKTKKVSINWRKLKNKYRHIAHLPSSVYYGNMLNVIISIDQSGSMSDLELRKINYIISKLVKRVKSCRVIIHDDKVVYNKEFKKNVDKQLEKEILKTRYATGGTSHKEVFDIIEEEFEKKSREDFLILIFSDMESDIEEIWNNYEWTSHLKTYLVSSYKIGVRHVSKLPATKIIMETGEMFY